MMEHQAARGERLIYQAKRIWSHLSSPGPHESGFSLDKLRTSEVLNCTEG